jgi:hypothetical protein
VARSSRTYTRDSRGRFASTPGSGSRKPTGGLPKRQPRKVGSPPPKRRGLVTQRAAVRRSAAKLRGNDPADQSLSGTLSRRAQRGALTKAQNRLAAAQQSGRRRIQSGVAQGVIRPGRRRASPTPGPGNNIRSTKRRGRSPLALKANAIRTYTPVTRYGKKDKANRTPEGKAARRIANWRALNDAGLADINKRISANELRRARRYARHLANSKRRDTEGQVARYMLGFARPEDIAAARRVIARRGRRAAAAADRGSEAGKRAADIYGPQLTPRMPKGKTKGRNSLRPGPRNTTGEPPKKRRPRKRKP